MRLVVDASTVVAEALRARGRRLLANPALDLIAASAAWDETEHELHKRVALLAERGHLEPGHATALRSDVTAILGDRGTIAPPDLYGDRLPEARQRVPRDPADAPPAALALALACGIWTNDQDFFGCGLPVWATDVLLWYLEQG